MGYMLGLQKLSNGGGRFKINRLMKIRIIWSIVLFAVSIQNPFAQILKPGFDKSEFLELLKISARSSSDTSNHKFPTPEYHKLLYRSPVTPLDNGWSLWLNTKSHTAVISIRGTTVNFISWIENFYAAMVPASGELQLSNTEKFKYNLAKDSDAAVHVGWLIGLATIAKDIVSKIDSCQQSGIHEFMISGHSQGGAIAFLLTSYLNDLRNRGVIDSEIVFKTYCIAAPKPGNLHYAYDYESATQLGYAFNVVNAKDWVPETPMSVQTVEDFNRTNPFENPKKAIKEQPFPKNLALRHVYNRLEKPPRKAQKRYQKYLGKMLAGFILDYYPELKTPAYYPSNNYVRAGRMIVLQPDAEYMKLFPDNPKTMFVHHFYKPYFYLAQKMDERIR